MKIIIAPHPDDEIIGCYSYLKNYKCEIIYTEGVEEERIIETKNLKKYFDINKQYYLDTKSLEYFLEKNNLLKNDNLFLFPDPINEIHPDHRKQGHIGESMARQGFDVIFYSTIMNVPWITKIVTSFEKEISLNNIYPSQRSLWEYDHKYFLFEAYHKWIF